MTLAYDETYLLIQLVLSTDETTARKKLNSTLAEVEKREPEFYMGVLEHGPSMNFTSEEWSDFFSKIPERLFRAEPALMNKLSPRQRETLPPATFSVF